MDLSACVCALRVYTVSCRVEIYVYKINILELMHTDNRNSTI